MEADEKKKAIQGAKVLEKHGRYDSAVQLLSQAGAYEEAVRVLSSQRRFSEAAQLLVNSLGTPLDEIHALKAEGKKLALLAAICFSRAGQTAQSVELFVALREYQRAAEVLQKAGDPIGAARVLASGGKKFGASMPTEPAKGVGGAAITLESAHRLEIQGKHQLAIQAYVQLKRYAEAGRVAELIGLPGDAGSFYAEAGLVYEAGNCYLRAGDSGKALENFVRVPREDRRYRAACLEVVRLASDLNYVGLKVDHFLARLIEEGPQEPRELEAFYLLSKLYKNHDLLENAKEVLNKLLAQNPNYRDARKLLANLEHETKPSAHQYNRILRDELSYHGSDARGPSAPVRSAAPPALPDLPPLPSPPNPFPAAPVSAIGNLGREVGEEVERISREINPTAGAAAERTGNTLFAVGVPTPAAPPSTGVAPAGFPRIAPGEILADRYRLEEEIGRGGMASVFRAADLELGEEIAIKVFTQLLDDEQGVVRFRQELQLTRQLVHPNIIRLFDIGVFRGCRFITMELLVGGDLKSRVGKPLPEKEGIDLLIQACHGLQAAHERGIIHRDIKPENLYITRENVLKVMDFGIAKRQMAKGVTVAGMVAGTPEYISPEQITNFTAVTPASDLYSLGVVAYEMFAGRVPFQASELVPLLMMQIKEIPTPPSALNPSISKGLEQAILKLLEKAPEKRFADCRSLAQELARLRRSG